MSQTLLMRMIGMTINWYWSIVVILLVCAYIVGINE